MESVEVVYHSKRPCWPCVDTVSLVCETRMNKISVM